MTAVAAAAANFDMEPRQIVVIATLTLFLPIPRTSQQNCLQGWYYINKFPNGYEVERRLQSGIPPIGISLWIKRPQPTHS